LTNDTLSPAVATRWQADRDDKRTRPHVFVKWNAIRDFTQDLTGNEFKVLNSFLSHGNREDICYVTHQTIGTELGLKDGERDIKKVVASLVQKGWLKKVPPIEGAPQDVAHHQVLIPWYLEAPSGGVRKLPSPKILGDVSPDQLCFSDTWDAGKVLAVYWAGDGFSCISEAYVGRLRRSLFCENLDVVTVFCEWSESAWPQTATTGERTRREPEAAVASLCAALVEAADHARTEDERGHHQTVLHKYPDWTLRPMPNGAGLMIPEGVSALRRPVPRGLFNYDGYRDPILDFLSRSIADDAARQE
jgi:hypothetical protein